MGAKLPCVPATAGAAAAGAAETPGGRVYAFHAREPITMPTKPASKQYRTTRTRLIVVMRVFSQIQNKDTGRPGASPIGPIFETRSWGV